MSPSTFSEGDGSEEVRKACKCWVQVSIKSLPTGKPADCPACLSHCLPPLWWGGKRPHRWYFSPDALVHIENDHGIGKCQPCSSQVLPIRPEKVNIDSNMTWNIQICQGTQEEWVQRSFFSYRNIYSSRNNYHRPQSPFIPRSHTSCSLLSFLAMNTAKAHTCLYFINQTPCCLLPGHWRIGLSGK